MCKSNPINDLKCVLASSNKYKHSGLSVNLFPTCRWLLGSLVLLQPEALRLACKTKILDNSINSTSIKFNIWMNKLIEKLGVGERNGCLVWCEIRTGCGCKIAQTFWYSDWGHLSPNILKNKIDSHSKVAQNSHNLAGMNKSAVSFLSFCIPVMFPGTDIRVDDDITRSTDHATAWFQYDTE